VDQQIGNFFFGLRVIALRGSPKLPAISDPAHRQTVIFFTTKASVKLHGLAKSKLGRFIASFSLHEIPLPDICSGAEAIQSDPGDALLRILQFDRPIAGASFDFLIELWAGQRSYEPFAIWNSLAPQMFRLLRCFARQMRAALPSFA
jgi:hypothetical protein